MDELLRQLADIDAVSTLRCDYTKTLALLRALKAGSVSLDDVTLLADGGWTVEAAEQPPPPDPPEPPDYVPPDPTDESGA